MRSELNQIIDLDMRRSGVVVELYQTMLADAPALARVWRDLFRADVQRVLPHRSPPPFPTDLIGGSVELLLNHMHYGYVVEWLDRWREDSVSLKADLCHEYGLMPDELDAHLNAELARRRGIDVPREPA
jgi:hypothetical protein